MTSDNTIGIDNLIPFDKIKVEETEDDQKTQARCGDNTLLCNKLTADPSYLNIYDFFVPKLEIGEDQKDIENLKLFNAASINIASSNINNEILKCEDDMKLIDQQCIMIKEEENLIIKLKKEKSPITYSRYSKNPQKNHLDEGKKVANSSIEKTKISVEHEKSSTNGSKDKKEDTNKPYSCRLCNERFVKEYHRKKHMQIHIGDEEFKCYICDFKSYERRLLYIHLNDHIVGNPYSCHLCDYKCKDKSTLTKHVKSHAGHKLFACNFCEYKTKNRESLKFHIRTHTGDKPYPCHLCQYKAARKSILVIHLRLHTGEKPYQCDICNFKFNQRCHLISHMRVHTGVCPYTCDICGNKYKQSTNLKVHMRVHTDERPYICSMCKQKFNRKCAFIIHVKSRKCHKQPIKCNA